jgi:hypothetical protein
MRRAIALMLFVTLLQSALAYAALGGSPSDFGGTTLVKPAARRLAATGTNSTNSTTNTTSTTGATAASEATTAGGDAVYTISQSTLDSGTVVREYSDTGGKVFAVSWSGPTLPDLRTLLGEKFAVMTGAAGARAKAGHSQLALARPDVVVVSNGHMRAFAGHAWLPGALPAGFDTTTIE